MFLVINLNAQIFQWENLTFLMILIKKKDIVKIYKDFLKASIFKFDEHYCDTKENSNSSYLGDLNLLLNMMLLAPKDYHSQDYINNKSKLVIKLILSGDEIKQLFPEKVVTSVGNHLVEILIFYTIL